jgi:uncharacterized protein (TIGR03083 family)
MRKLSPDRFYAEIETSTAALAVLVGERDPGMRIPTCPDWSLRQLATHVGRAHRWAAEITRTRSADFIPFREVPDGRFPDNPAEQGPWLRAGAQLVIDAVREAGSDEVWAAVGPVPASFWARRMAHETLVHRSDAELAAGQEPLLDPELAADAIDEWLEVMSGPPYGSPDPRLAALPEGAVLHVHATDDVLDEAGEWLVSHTADAVVVQPGHGKGDVAVTGPAGSLLLVLLRRIPASDPAVTVHGDAAVLARWLEHTPF